MIDIVKWSLSQHAGARFALHLLEKCRCANWRNVQCPKVLSRACGASGRLGVLVINVVASGSVTGKSCRWPERVEGFAVGKLPRRQKNASVSATNLYFVSGEHGKTEANARCHAAKVVNAVAAIFSPLSPLGAAWTLWA